MVQKYFCQQCGRAVHAVQTRLCLLCTLEPEWPQIRVLLPPFIRQGDVDILEPKLKAWLLEDGAGLPADPRPTSPLARQVAQSGAQWRWWREREDAYIKAANQIDRSTEFLILMRSAMRRFRQYGRMLLIIGFFDIRKMSPVPGTTLDDAISRINHLLPGLIERASLAEAMFLIGVDRFLWARGLGKQVEAATAIAVESIRRQIRDLVPRLVGMAINSPSESEQMAGSIAFAGWASTHINVNKDDRLWQALSDTDQPLYYTLCERLPTAAYLAWHDMGSPVSLKALKNKMTRSLKLDTSQNRSKSSKHIVPPELFSLEDMWRLEEAHRAIDRVVAQLPPREAAIWDLVTQEVPYAEVAMRLGIAEGTVKSTVSRVHEKLRKATSA